MSQLNVRYDYGFNCSGTGQHEVLEYVTTRAERPTCRCIHPQHHTSQQVEEGPYVVLYTEKKETAVVIAAILNVDGTDNNFPLTPMAKAVDVGWNRIGTVGVNPDPGPTGATALH